MTWHVQDGRLILRITFQAIEAHALPVRSLTFSHDGNSLITASDDGCVKMFDAKGGQLTGTYSGHLSWVLSVAASPLGEQFATGYASGNYLAEPIPLANLLPLFPLFSSSDKTVKVWDIKTKS